ncbi:MAG: NAD-dependent epimerase/dehydratase family protein [Anaerolineae bacterium]|nr:NAD-dependent epimerase/dehydratase family protein [Anaerolineae bacterium]
MSILVTGAAGHVGANLVRASLEKGEHVRALVHRDRRALAGLDVEIVEGDISIPASLEHAFAGAEVVYHAAAEISLQMDNRLFVHQINVLGTRNVVEACLHAGVRRLVHFSSIHALNYAAQPGLIDETCPLVDDHHSPYSDSKADSEREVQRGIAHGLDAVILRPTAVIGPYDFRPSHIGQVLLELARGTLPALVKGGFDWVDARDVADGALRATEQAPTGASYMLSGHRISVSDLAATIEHITGQRAPRFVCPMALARVGAPFASALARLTGARPLYTSVSLSALRLTSPISSARASHDLGYQPRPFDDTISDTLTWFREVGFL